MEKKTFKKLQLKKENIARLGRDEMQNVAGGMPETTSGSCGPVCRDYGPPVGPEWSVYVACDPISFHCNSWPNDSGTCVADGQLKNRYCGTVAASFSCYMHGGC